MKIRRRDAKVQRREAGGVWTGILILCGIVALIVAIEVARFHAYKQRYPNAAGWTFFFQDK